MDHKHSETHTDTAGSDVSRQTVVTNLRFGTSSGERRPALHNLGEKSQSEPGEDYLTRSLTFYRNGSKPNLSSKEDGNEKKERVKKTAGKSKTTLSVQADGQLAGSNFGRTEFPSKMKYSSDLSSAKSRNECFEPSKSFSGKSSEDDVREEKHSVSELRARFQSQNEITSVPRVGFCNAHLKESKSKGEVFERCWREKENGSRDRWGPEDENPFLETQLKQERRNKSIKHKTEHLDGTDVSGRMDSTYFGDPADMAGSVDTSEVTRQTVQGNLKFDPSSEQTVQGNLKFDPSSGEIGAALRNLGNKFQSEPGEEYPTRSMVFHRNRNKPSLASEGDGSETKERVKKIAGGSKKMTHSVQADGEASCSLGGRDVEKTDPSSKFNTLSASALQSEEFAGTRPRYWRGKENGFKYQLETG